jgi:hypothetical protein
VKKNYDTLLSKNGFYLDSILSFESSDRFPEAGTNFLKPLILCIEQAFLTSLTHILRLTSPLDSILGEKQP